MDREQSRAAVITGAARGMGRSHACALAKLGINVVLADLGDPEAPEKPGEDMLQTLEMVRQFGVDALAMKCDVRSETDVHAMMQACVDRFGQVDVLVANAGVMGFGWTWELTEEEVWRMLDVNLMGVWRSNKVAIPHMIDAGGGRIINISSTAGLKATPDMSHYGMSKAGVVSLTKTLAKEVARYGITVNAVCPTVVGTEMTINREFFGHLTRLSGRSISTYEEADEFLRQSHPLKLGGYLSASDVSNAVVWLSGEESKYVTGAVIAVDAGSML